MACNFIDQDMAVKPLGVPGHTPLTEKLANIEAVAIPRDIPAADAKGGYRPSGAVQYAEKHSTSKPLFPWQLCSGYAHGRPWAYLGMSEQEHFEITDPNVLKLKLTSDPMRVLYPTSAAYQLIIDVVKLLNQRSNP